MAKLTLSNVENTCSQSSLNSKNQLKEVNNKRLKRLTHLIVNEKCIHSISNLSICRNLKVIYLQNNCLSKIENLQFATNLTHLYLQHNKITKIENLENLKNLITLYLGYNSINVVEGLENLKKLHELHIENQNLNDGESIYFEPRTIDTLCKYLEFLNITGNKITCLRDIRSFCSLKTLEAKNNLIKDIEDLIDVVESLPCLVKLSLQGNPVTQCYRYRESLIANSSWLMILDGKYISETSRDFMKKFKHEKQLQQTKKPSKTTLSDDITSSLNLPFAFKMSISRAISQRFDKQFSTSTISTSGELKPQIFPHWKSAPSIRGMKNNHHMPRPFWRSATNIRQDAKKQTLFERKSILSFPSL